METVKLNGNEQSRQDADRQQQLKNAGQIPRHIAVIMDGNGRWARQRGNHRVHGHKAGVDSVRDITETCAQLGVEYVTLFAFSTENWARPSQEVNTLMSLLIQTLRRETRKIHDNDIRLHTIGQTGMLPDKCQKELEEGVRTTAGNKRMQLTLALSYSGRWDMNQAIREIAEKVGNGELQPGEIDERLISDHLDTAGMPDPDLLIRTSGEMRISNFLLWQLAYSEIYVTSTLWPDFRRENLYEAIESYQQRDRRFGKVSAQEGEASA